MNPSSGRSPWPPEKGVYVAYAPSLIQELKNLVDSCVPCPPVVEDPLLDDVELAIKQLLKGNDRAAASILKVFVKTTERFIGSRQLPAEIGFEFIALAEQVIAELEAEAGGPRGRGAAAETGRALVGK